VNDDLFERAPDWWIVSPWPTPMTTEQYQRDAIAGADDDEPEDLG
jgi:hypothetical protein